MKKFLVCLVAAVAVLGIGVVPGQILSGLNRYTVVSPISYSYQPTVSCTGTVTAENGVKLMVGSNTIIKELYAADGSWVTAGSVLAVTEPPAPEQVFLSQSIELPGNSFDPTQLQSMAAQYGVDIGSLTAGAAANSLLQQALPQSTIQTQQAVAPISGIVNWSTAVEGSFVPAGSQLCTILGLDRYKAVVQVPAEDARRIVVDAQAVITGSEVENQQYTGTVRSIGNTILHAVGTGGYSSTVEVELALEAPADSIRHGANVNGTILVGEPQMLLTLPYEAVQQDEHNREFVYCIYGNNLRKQYVQTGQELDSCIEIVSGVRPDDVVATGNPKNPNAKFMLEVE